MGQIMEQPDFPNFPKIRSPLSGGPALQARNLQGGTWAYLFACKMGSKFRSSWKSCSPGGQIRPNLERHDFPKLEVICAGACHTGEKLAREALRPTGLHIKQAQNFG